MVSARAPTCDGRFRWKIARSVRHNRRSCNAATAEPKSQTRPSSATAAERDDRSRSQPGAGPAAAPAGPPLAAAVTPLLLALILLFAAQSSSHAEALTLAAEASAAAGVRPAHRSPRPPPLRYTSLMPEARLQVDRRARPARGPDRARHHSRSAGARPTICAWPGARCRAITPRSSRSRTDMSCATGPRATAPTSTANRSPSARLCTAIASGSAAAAAPRWSS